MSDLKDRLRQLAYSNKDTSSYMDDDIIDITPNEERPKKAKKKKTFAEKLNETENELVSMNSKILGDFEDIDDLLDEITDYDDDTILKNELIASGKKYNRVNIIDGDTRSELDKTFGPLETLLDKEIKELTAMDKDIAEDIFRLRSVRTGRSPKSLADLYSVRNTTHSNINQTIKSKIDIKKTKYDIALKQEKNKPIVADTENATYAVQKLLSMNRGDLMSSMYGEYDDELPYGDTLEDKYIAEKIAIDQESEDLDDGDLFIKYENIFDHLELTLDRNDPSHKRVRAIDKDGNEIYDYPVPSVDNDLRFNVNPDTGLAVDQLNRRYEVRYMDDENPQDIYFED